MNVLVEKIEDATPPGAPRSCRRKVVSVAFV